MKVEFRDGAIQIIAENHRDNAMLRYIGADHDRAMVSFSVVKQPELQLSGETPFEPLVIILAKADDLEDIARKEQHVG